MRNFVLATCVFVSFLVFAHISTDLRSEEKEAYTKEERAFAVFVDEYTKKAAPLEKEANLAEWNAYVTGSEKDYKRKAAAALALDLLHSGKEDYRKLKAWEKSGTIKEPVLKRELTLLLNEYGPKQIDATLLKKIIDKEAQVQQAFNTYRGTIDGKVVSEKDICALLRDSTDRVKRKKAWEAQKGTGSEVAASLIELVKLRNEAARSLGFDNYYEMSIHFDDQDLKELTDIFSKLYLTTEWAFSENKKALDAALAKRFNIKTEELRPWDYPNPFFQDASGVFAAGLNRFFKDSDIPEIDRRFYRGIGLPVDEVLRRSDLFEKPGKSPHAFCYDIDRSGDVRILANLRKEEESCATLLHESGHAVYDRGISRSLPWLLRQPAHIFTTEASAMMFERLTKNGSWLHKMAGVSQEDAGALTPVLAKDLALQQLVFCRWTEVMFNFERELYRDPGQDLNTLWWDMVEKYQHLKRPEGRNKPDWASKIHLASAPVYYHNYMLGELTVSQLMHTLGTKVLKKGASWKEMDMVGDPAIGSWLNEHFYGPGARYHWSELLIRATGESLNPRYFAEQFITAKKERLNDHK